jgi:hypothetical protein
LRGFDDGVLHRSLDWCEGSRSIGLTHLWLLLFMLGKWRGERIAEWVFSILHWLIRLLLVSLNSEPNDFLGTKVRLLSKRRMHSCRWGQWFTCPSFLLNS